MKSVAPWVYYTVYRILMFAVPLAALLAFGIWPWLAIVFATIIGLCLSILFLRRAREGTSRGLYAARHPDQEPVNVDADTEDAALNRAESGLADTTLADAASADSALVDSDQVRPNLERESKPKQ